MMRKMNKLVLCLSFLLLPFAVKAQTTQGRFGYLSYNAIFQAMPEYEVSRQKLADLKSKYDKEAQRSEILIDIFKLVCCIQYSSIFDTLQPTFFLVIIYYKCH